MMRELRSMMTSTIEMMMDLMMMMMITKQQFNIKKFFTLFLV